MKTRTLSILTIAASVGLTASPLFAQATAVTAPVGYRTEVITAGVFNLLSPDLSDAVAAAGDFESSSPNTLTDDEADFVAAGVGAGYIVKITSGANLGITAVVTGATATSLTTQEDISSAVTAGDMFEVRRIQTISDLFGPANEKGLLAGTEATADLVWIPQGSGFVRVYYTNGTPPFVTAGWKAVGQGNVNFGNQIVTFTDGIQVQRKGGTPLSVVFTGHVETTETVIGVESGFNFVSRVIPVGVSLAASGLENDITRGTETTADLVWVPNGTGGYSRYYYTNGTPPFVTAGWKAVGGGNVDQAAVLLSSANIIQRKAGGASNITARIPASLDL